MTERPPTVIVGAGIVGAAIAFELVQRGVPVVVVDRGVPGSGASSRSFGWINASFADTSAYYRLRHAAISAYRDIARQLPGLGLRWGGSLWWEEEGPAMDAQAAKLAALGYEAEIIDAGTFSALEPMIADPPARSIYARIEGAADGAELAGAFLKAAAAQGARVLTGCNVTGFLRNGQRITGIQTSHGDIAGETVVVAAGAQCADLLAGAGVHLPMDNKPGLILHTQPVAPMLRHIVLSPDIHFRQDPAGRIIAGEVFSGDGPGAGRIGTDPFGLAEDLMVRLRGRLPDVALALEAVILGVRPVPVDGLPAVGPALDAPGLYIAAMHSGITLAPLIGRLAARELAGGDEADLLASFRPGRFA